MKLESINQCLASVSITHAQTHIEEPNEVTEEDSNSDNDDEEELADIEWD